MIIPSVQFFLWKWKKYPHCSEEIQYTAKVCHFYKKKMEKSNFLINIIGLAVQSEYGFESDLKGIENHIQLSNDIEISAKDLGDYLSK